MITTTIEPTKDVPELADASKKKKKSASSYGLCGAGFATYYFVFREATDNSPTGSTSSNKVPPNQQSIRTTAPTVQPTFAQVFMSSPLEGVKLAFTKYAPVSITSVVGTLIVIGLIVTLAIVLKQQPKLPKPSVDPKLDDPSQHSALASFFDKPLNLGLVVFGSIVGLTILVGIVPGALKVRKCIKVSKLDDTIKQGIAETVQSFNELVASIILDLPDGFDFDAKHPSSTATMPVNFQNQDGSYSDVKFKVDQNKDFVEVFRDVVWMNAKVNFGPGLFKVDHLILMDRQDDQGTDYILAVPMTTSFLESCLVNMEDVNKQLGTLVIEVFITFQYISILSFIVGSFSSI
jgi:hypothetical protein